VEEPLEVRVNGEPLAVVVRTPGHEVELAAGFCLTEGIVDSFSEILTVGFCEEAGADVRNVVNVILGGPSIRPGGGRTDGAAGPPLAPSSGANSSPCGVRILEDLELRMEALAPGPVFAARELFELQDQMVKRQGLRQLTLGTHAVALARLGGELLAVREDIGRHNALDKAIGFAMFREIDCAECVALLSGRISYELVQKAVRAGIHVVATVSSATGLAVELADRMNCTLAGQLRGSAMVVYTHPSRIAE
jgi:FdhD protein